MSPDVLTNPDVICNAVVLGEILGQTDRHVRRLVKDGVLECPRTKLHGMHFRLADSVQRFVKYRCDLAAKEAESRNGEYEKARTRKAQAAAAMMELQLATKRGEYLYKPDVEFHLSMLLRNCRDRILAIPSRTMHQLLGRTNPMECNKIVGDELNLALNEIADQKCFDWARMRREQTAYLREQGMPDDEIESILDE